MSDGRPWGTTSDPMRNSTPVQATEPATEPVMEPRDDELSDDADAAEIEKHIEQTREELGDTVEALVAKFDVRSQVRETQERVRGRAGDLTDRVRDVMSQHGTKIAAGGAAVAAAVAGFVAWRRTR